MTQAYPDDQQDHATVRFHLIWPQIPDAAVGQRAARAFMSPRVPSLQVDGRSVLVNVGAQDILVAAGTHHLSGSVITPDGPIGVASLDLDVHEGDTIDVFYTAPAFGFRSGAMALTPTAPDLKAREHFYRTATFGGGGAVALLGIVSVLAGMMFGYLLAS